MRELSKTEINYNEVRLWLERAESNAGRCFYCLRISQASRLHDGQLHVLKLGGLELSPETQIAHLARCVGKESHA